MSYTLHFWNSDDQSFDEGIVKLLDRALPVSVHTVEHFRWKHAKNPEGPSVVVFAVDQVGQVAALRAFWRFRLTDGSREYLGFQSCDTATDPSHERRGLFTRLTKAGVERVRDEGGDIIFNFPNNNSYPLYRKLGWEDADHMVSLLMLCRPLKGLANGLLSKMWRGEKSPSFKSYREDDFEDVSEAEYPAGYLQSVKTTDWLRWRFGMHPKHGYQKVSWGGGTVVGRLGIRKGLMEFLIMDLRLPSDAERCLRGLLAQVKQLYPCEVITVLLNARHPWVPLFKKCWFFTLKNRVRFVDMVLNPEIDLCEKKWALMSSDVDTL